MLAGRVIPGIRTLVSIPAGLARMDFLKFLAATYVGSYIWCTLLIGAGYLLGHEWPIISHYVKQGFPFFVATGMLAMAIVLLLTSRGRLLAWARVRNTD